jgi:hypothetical protein
MRLHCATERTEGVLGLTISLCPRVLITPDYMMIRGAVLRMIYWKMRPALTTEGHVQIVFAKSQAGDKICRLWNCVLPVVLRPTGGGFRFVGEVYGEAEKDQRDDTNDELVNFFGRDSTAVPSSADQTGVSWNASKLRILG